MCIKNSQQQQQQQRQDTSKQQEQQDHELQISDMIEMTEVKSPLA